MRLCEVMLFQNAVLVSRQETCEVMFADETRGAHAARVEQQRHAQTSYNPPSTSQPRNGGKSC